MNLPLYSGVASQTFITIEVTRPCMQLATLHSIKPILVKTQLTYEEDSIRCKISFCVLDSWRCPYVCTECVNAAKWGPVVTPETNWWTLLIWDTETWATVMVTIQHCVNSNKTSQPSSFIRSLSYYSRVHHKCNDLKNHYLGGVQDGLLDNGSCPSVVDDWYWFPF